MLVLGIDPGIEITGFAIIDVSNGERKLLECGVIRTSKDLSLPERLTVIHEDLNSIITQYPDIAVAGVEQLFFAKNVTTAFAVGQARGVILFTLAQLGITIESVLPAHVKMAVVGHGNAKKHEVQKMIQLLFGLAEPPQPDDAADAVAVAIATHARTT